VHSVAHFAREVTEDLTHADSRLWSTLQALLLRPGFLTREFLDGRRVRYLPPLRLYLVLSVLFFLTMSLTRHEAELVEFRTDAGPPSIKLVQPGDVPGLAARPGETAQQREERLCTLNYDGPFPSLVAPLVTKTCRSLIEGKTEVLKEALWHNLPKALFVFLPLLALIMKALYWRPPRYYIEHLLFFLHNHAFAFLIFSAVALTQWLAPKSIVGWLEVVVGLYVPYYLYVSMRKVYGQGRWLTAAKFAVLAFTYILGALITLLLTAMYSVWSA
jgi:hypothetical protein